MLLPTYAVKDGAGWRGSVHGWVFERDEDSLFGSAAITALAVAIGVDAAAKIVRERVSWFTVDNEGGKCLIIHHDGEKTEACSGDNGHAEAEATLDDRPPGVLTTLVIDDDRAREFTGELHLIAAEGISVVSDIDDTIKITDVTDSSELLQNTFVRPFREAPGMSALYQRWAGEGAAFHFVSSSPWQLYPGLREFMDAAGFPAGTFHLKLFRLTDSSVLNLFAPGTETKPRIIEGILEDFPDRQFVLVGDSGEVDPEVYGALLVDHPEQIRHAYIRDVGNTGDERMNAAFADVPPTRWTVFTDPADLTL